MSLSSWEWLGEMAKSTVPWLRGAAESCEHGRLQHRRCNASRCREKAVTHSPWHNAHTKRGANTLTSFQACGVAPQRCELFLAPAVHRQLTHNALKSFNVHVPAVWEWFFLSRTTDTQLLMVFLKRNRAGYHRKLKKLVQCLKHSATSHYVWEREEHPQPHPPPCKVSISDFTLFNREP